MIIIVGLGNPGKKYQKTRHNVGFITINNLQLTIDTFSDWKFKKKFNAEISEGKIDSKKIILVKPRTFMNNSGMAVKLLTKFYAQDPKNLIIIHDDVDLILGKIKISKSHGSAGHKGVQSIIDELKTKSFIRFRIGIKPKVYTLNSKNLDKFVLKNFTKKEEEIIKQVIKTTIEGIEIAIKQGIEKAMNKFNKSR
jgi:PTH1 family peptidyl-tRNA hydrolase